jgi:hypothetical protein
MITIRQEGDFSKLSSFFEKLKEVVKFGILDKYGRAGVEALSSATPIGETGETANSWYYKISRTETSVSIIFCNSNVTPSGTPIAILLQYGHGTRNGGYVEGVDYINPAIVPIFEKIADEAWREVKNI